MRASLAIFSAGILFSLEVPYVLGKIALLFFGPVGFIPMPTVATTKAGAVLAGLPWWFWQESADVLLYAGVHGWLAICFLFFCVWLPFRGLLKLAVYLGES